jgi:hypothetical protein
MIYVPLTDIVPRHPRKKLTLQVNPQSFEIVWNKFTPRLIIFTIFKRCADSGAHPGIKPNKNTRRETLSKISVPANSIIFCPCASALSVSFRLQHRRTTFTKPVSRTRPLRYGFPAVRTVESRVQGKNAQSPVAPINCGAHLIFIFGQPSLSIFLHRHRVCISPLLHSLPRAFIFCNRSAACAIHMPLRVLVKGSLATNTCSKTDHSDDLFLIDAVIFRFIADIIFFLRNR